MTAMLMHEQTAQHLARFVNQPSHALLLIGPVGGGKEYAARQVAQQLLGLLTVEEVQDYPYFKAVTPEKDKSTIGIEAARDLQQFVKLRLPTAGSRRIILIADAHTLTSEAQNAILKLLEEPPENTIFLLTAASGQAMLPTIRSRTQAVTIHPPLQSDIVAYFESQGHDSKAIQQAYMMSGGLPGLIDALLNDADHPMKASALTARKLLQSNQFERLCMVDELSKNKPEALQVLLILQHMARAATAQGAKAIDGSATKRIQQWHKIHKAAYEAEQAYAVSGQAKLTLTNLMLSM